MGTTNKQLAEVKVKLEALKRRGFLRYAHTVIADPTEDNPDHIKFADFTPGPTAFLAPSFLIYRPPAWIWGMKMGPDLFYEPLEFLGDWNPTTWRKE